MCALCDAPSHSLKDSNANLKVKTTKEERVGVWSLVRSTLGVEGHVGAPEWGLGRMTSGAIIHIDLHSLNNKLVNAWLKHFWCTYEPRAYMDSRDSPWPRLRGSHHLPPYSVLHD
jgi:hypothetical protein